ncbi:hypothetical protein [Thalassomonas actiniarum]|uniref:Uncharacterized protein n=1 Tax=Thalassomonas actiniarum TaxID=485447 RepID=A0AAF0C2R7_9GAMM|nr:hypothetical protein [Thalassomonas actiniarum]WDD98213.1 hypothetical protein SG35_023520 [Thalassomonas actiniarum]
MKKFRRDYGVYTCPHVFKKERPVKLVIRDPDSDWQFFCGDEQADEAEECHLVHVSHLLEDDKSLEIMAELEPEERAERKDEQTDWEFFELDKQRRERNSPKFD